MTSKRALQEKLEAQLADWHAKLAYMQYLAITAPGGPKPKHAMVIELLRHRQEKARMHLGALKRRGKDNWHDLKSALERQWETLENDFDHSLRWFQQEALVYTGDAEETRSQEPRARWRARGANGKLSRDDGRT